MLYYRFDLDFWEWIVEIGWYTYWNCTYLVMVAMVLLAANSSLCCFGSVTENEGILVLLI